MRGLWIAAARRPLVLSTAALLLFAIVGQLVQKLCESRVVCLHALALSTKGHVEDVPMEFERWNAMAFRWQVIHVTCAALAGCTWAAAMYRGERHRRWVFLGAWVVYVGLLFLLV
jgi:hypothetical protein